MHFFALLFFGLGIAPNFSVFFCEFRPAGCLALRNSQKNTEKLGDIPNPKKKKAKNVHFSAERLQYSKKNPVLKQKKLAQKVEKTVGFSSVNLQILKAVPIFLGGGIFHNLVWGDFAHPLKKEIQINN